MTKFFLLLSIVATVVGTPKANAALREGAWTLEVPSGAPGLPPGTTTQKIMAMLNDRDADIRNLNIVVDGEQKVAGMQVINERDPNDNKVFGLAEVEGKEGAVLLIASDRKAIIMQGQLNRATQEGRFVLKYLANGFTMRYEKCEFDLKKDGSNWLVKNIYNGEFVTSINIITWSLGITTIEGLCPQQ